MAYYLTSNIEIGIYRFQRVNEVVIKSSWKTLTDTCEVKLSNLKGLLKDSIKYGDKVKIDLGYDGKLITEFEGYVSKIKPDFPFTVICEDGMYLLKKAAAISIVFDDILLVDLLKQIIPDSTEINLSASIPEVLIYDLVIDEMTPAQILDLLQEKYFLTSYFRGVTLFVGLPYTETESQGLVGFNFEKNIIESSLEFRRSEDIVLGVKVVSILADNSRIEVFEGDKQGEIKTIHKRNIYNESALKEIAVSELEKYKYSGYKGSFKSFGIPYVAHSDSVALTDNNYPERAGNYLVDSVNTDFGVNGFNRTISLGRSV